MNTVGKYLFITISGLLVTTGSFADDAFAIGMRAFNLRDYTAARLRLSEEAEAGHVLAQELVAQFFATGQAAPKDLYEASYWYNRAGKTRDNSLQVKRLEDEGIALPENDAAILQLYLQQAEAGDVAAAYRLGNVYATGRGTNQDFKSAVDWYEKAAHQGHAYAQFQLARFSYNGQGMVKNPEQALRWMKSAADNGVTLAKYHYADFLRTGVAEQRDIAIARKYYAAAANEGYGLAQYELAQLLLPEAADFDSRVEVLKWVFLYASHFEKQTSQAIVMQFASQLNAVQAKEFLEAQKRAWAFIRGAG